MTFSSKFKVDIDEAGKDSWYQFIMPGDRMEQGEIWKWRQRKVPLNSMNISLKDLNTFVIKSKRISESALMKPKMKRKARN